MQDGVVVIQGAGAGPGCMRICQATDFFFSSKWWPGLTCVQTEAFGGGKGCSNAPTTPLFQEFEEEEEEEEECRGMVIQGGRVARGAIYLRMEEGC